MNMIISHITTAELDAIARLGLDDLKECFSTTPPKGAMERAELTLKLIRQGTSRMSGENNRIAVGLKVARMIGLSGKDVQPLWASFASGQSVTIEGAKSGSTNQGDGEKRASGEKTARKDGGKS
jgi:hypothetical protein